MSEPPPDLTEAEQHFRWIVAGSPLGNTKLAVLLAEYDRRGTADVNHWRARALEAEGKVDGQAWVDLEEERDRLLSEVAGLREELSIAARILREVGKAAIVVRPTLAKPFPDAPSTSPWERFMESPARAAYNLGVRLTKQYGAAARSTPVAPAQTDCPERGIGDHDCVEHEIDAVASPGAGTPAEPTGTAALLALCDALDRLPAPEGGGRTVGAGGGDQTATEGAGRRRLLPGRCGGRVVTPDEAREPKNPNSTGGDHL